MAAIAGMMMAVTVTDRIRAEMVAVMVVATVVATVVAGAVAGAVATMAAVRTIRPAGIHLRCDSRCSA